MVGLRTYGGYVPRMRLQREAAFSSLSWYAPGLKRLSKGERSFCSWDEDCVTMGVEAARDCLGKMDRRSITRLVLSSTSHSFADRQNSTIIKEALNLDDRVAALDVSGSKRCATSALIDAFYAVEGGAGDTLCIASECNKHKPASEGELSGGHASAALLVSKTDGCAKLIGSHSVTVDFVDHFRKDSSGFDYNWEARWVREEGYGQIVVSAIKDTLEKLELNAGQIDYFNLGAPIKNVDKFVASKVGIAGDAVVDGLAGELGDAGTAQPFVLLSHLLERAQPNQKIMIVGFGGGCDVIVIETTQDILDTKPLQGISSHLKDKESIDNYTKYLSLSGLLDLEKGMRAELDQKPILTALYRDRDTVLGLVGGECSQTGTVQYPRTPVSVSLEERNINTQKEYPLADLTAKVLTFTADHLTYAPLPPAYYGNIAFDGGGRMLVEFCDVDDGDLEVGVPLRMMFRIKSIDKRRGFSQYFWKAKPVRIQS